jgi:hypothetical protein
MMLARVAICRDATTGVNGNRRLEKHAEALRERIEERGIGFFASAEDRRLFLKALSPVEHKRWLALMTDRTILHVLPAGHAPRIHEQSSLWALREAYGDDVDVIVCGREHAVALGLDQEYLLEETETPIVGALPDVSVSQALSALDDDAKQSAHIEAGTQRKAVWRTFFAPPARFATEVVIVDRYAYDQQTKHTATGFRWFVEQLQRDRLRPDPIKLQVVVQQRKSSAPLREQLADAITRFGLREPPEIFRTIKVRVATRNFGVRHLHDRFVRFDGRVITSTTGLSVLASQKVACQATVAPGPYRASERLLAKLDEGDVMTATWKARTALWKSGSMVLFDDD